MARTFSNSPTAFPMVLENSGNFFEPTEISVLPNLDVIIAQRRGEIYLYKNDSKKLKQIGFLNIQVAGGNYIELRNFIFKNCDKVKDNFVYVRGEFVANDLEGDFKKQGYKLKSIINYTAEPNLNIDHQLIQDLKNKLIDVIFIYSKRAADQLLKIILANSGM